LQDVAEDDTPTREYLAREGFDGSRGWPVWGLGGDGLQLRAGVWFLGVVQVRVYIVFVLWLLRLW
jgi:hypothetical protein